MNVAMDWFVATKEPPTAGRSDHTGFGELVHCIFDWLNEPGATQVLRRYWKEVLSAKQRPGTDRIEYF